MPRRFCADTGFVCVDHGVPMRHAGCDDSEHALCPEPACPARGQVPEETSASTNPTATHRSGDDLDDTSSDCDAEIVALGATTPAAPVYLVLCTLTKGARVAEARICPHPLGQELRFLVDRELLWSEVFTPGRGSVLGRVADAKRSEFEERGRLVLGG